MFKTKPVEPDKLGFKNAVHSNFSFLVKEYGFRPVKSESTSVRYENLKLYVIISIGRASLELKVEIGLLPNEFEINPVKFGLNEIIELISDEKETTLPYFQGGTKEQLQKNLPGLADLVKKYAKDVLKGDYLTIQNLERLRSDTSVGLSKEIRIRQSLR